MQKQKKIIAVIDTDGNSQFVMYYRALPSKDRGKFLALLMQLQEVNLLIAQRQLWVRRVKKGLYEMRCYVDKGVIHCAYFFQTPDYLILTNAYLKKGPIESANALMIAEKIRKEWELKNVD